MTDDAWQQLRTYVDGRIESVAAQIRNYPPPIAACDEQFNHLLRLRAVWNDHRKRFHRAAAETITIDEFLRTSGCADDFASALDRRHQPAATAQSTRSAHDSR